MSSLTEMLKNKKVENSNSPEAPAPIVKDLSAEKDNTGPEVIQQEQTEFQKNNKAREKTECYASPHRPALTFTVKGEKLIPTKQGLYFPRNDAEKDFLEHQINMKTGNVIKKFIAVIPEAK